MRRRRLSDHRLAGRRSALAGGVGTGRDRFERGEIDIDPHDKELAKQLVKIKWKLRSNGQIVIESKEEMRRRGLPSPDRADALVYAFANVDIPVVNVEDHAGQSITGDLLEKAW